jgi:hypothetical protein
MVLNPAQFDIPQLRANYTAAVASDAQYYQDPQPTEHFAKIAAGEHDYDLMHEEHERRMWRED